MRVVTRKLALKGVAALLLVAGLCSSADAFVVVNPNGLSPRARAYGLYGKLNTRNPWGEPATPGCTWSRIQMPTAHGLQWMDERQCQFDRGFG